MIPLLIRLLEFSRSHICIPPKNHLGTSLHHHHHRTPILTTLTTRRDQAEPSTSNVIAMPLPPASEVIKNQWVLMDPSVVVRLRYIGLCAPSHLRTPWGATELCPTFSKRSASYLDLHHFLLLIPI